MKIYVQFSDCGQHIRKWAFEPFEGGLGMAFPEDGPWRCFHCGDMFSDKAEAAEHFGEGNYEGEMPLCIEAATAEMKALVLTNREMWRRLDRWAGKIEGLEFAKDSWEEAARKLTGKASATWHDLAAAQVTANEAEYGKGVADAFDPIREALDVMREAVKDCPIKRARPPIPSSCQKCGADRGDDCGLQLNAERTFGQTVMELVEGKSE